MLLPIYCQNRQHSWPYRQTRSTVSATVNFVADLLPVSATVDFQQNRRCWIKLCRQCVPGFTVSRWNAKSAILFMFPPSHIPGCLIEIIAAAIFHWDATFQVSVNRPLGIRLRVCNLGVACGKLITSLSSRAVYCVVRCRRAMVSFSVIFN